jgi:glycosyltransferase involved in cell wall biosynthesis
MQPGTGMKLFQSMVATISRSPKLSVLLVAYNMERELPRTLHSLSPRYQQRVHENDYEVIVVDNGSSPPVDPGLVQSYGKQFRHYSLSPAPPSPVSAINLAARRARGRFVCIMIDGARMLSPGAIHHILAATRLHPCPITIIPSFHLGPDVQKESVKQGYSQTVEDDLLRKIKWEQNGYRLLEVSSFASSARYGLFRTPAESNCLTLSRKIFLQMGGCDERFDLPGGGLANHDLLARACEVERVGVIVILGEGNFHQLHGGIATNPDVDNWESYAEQYRQIRGKAYQNPTRQPDYFSGHLPPELNRSLQLSMEFFPPP